MLSSQTNLQGTLFRPFEDQYLITPLNDTRSARNHSSAHEPRPARNRPSLLSRVPAVLGARRTARKTADATC
jgi:hypothetical protein